MSDISEEIACFVAGARWAMELCRSIPDGSTATAYLESSIKEISAMFSRWEKPAPMPQIGWKRKPYTLSPQGRERKVESMKEYWRKRREEQTNV